VKVTGPAVSESSPGRAELDSGEDGDTEAEVEGDADTEGVRDGAGDAVADFLGFEV